jgi:hypothetical protein
LAVLREDKQGGGEEVPVCQIRFVTKEEFISQIRFRERQYVIRAWCALALMAIALGVVALFEHLGIRAGRLNKIWYGLPAGFLLIGTITLICWGKARGVPCLHCHKRVTGTAAQITAATGNCGYCGGEIFEQAAGGKPSV